MIHGLERWIILDDYCMFRPCLFDGSEHGIGLQNPWGSHYRCLDATRCVGQPISQNTGWSVRPGEVILVLYVLSVLVWPIKHGPSRACLDKDYGIIFSLIWLHGRANDVFLVHSMFWTISGEDCDFLHF